MKCNVKGIVLEKFTRGEGKDKKSYVRLYQTGERVNLDVNVSGKTFETALNGKELQLDVSVLAFKDNLYAREVF